MTSVAIVLLMSQQDETSLDSFHSCRLVPDVPVRAGMKKTETLDWKEIV